MAKRQQAPKVQKTLPSPAPRLGRFEWGVAFALTAILVALHVFNMFHAGGLWRDEAGCVNLAALPSVTQVWNHMEFDSFPILYYLVLRAWMAVSWLATDTGLRLFGLLVGLGLLGLLWLNARRLGYGLPLLSLAVFALNPVVIRYGDSLRGYGLGTGALLLTFTMLWKFTTSGRWWYALGSALVAVLTVQLLYSGAPPLFAVIAGCVAVALRGRLWRRALLLVATGLPAALSLLPYAEIVRRRASWDMLAQVHLPVSQYATIGVNALQGNLFPQPSPVTLWGWPGILILVVVLALVAQSRRWLPDLTAPQRDLALFGAVTMIVATVGFLIFLKRLNYPTQAWYYIPLMAVLVTAGEMAVAVVMTRYIVKVVRVILVVLLVVVLSLPAFSALQLRQTNIDLIAEQLQTGAKDGELIVVSPWYDGVTFGRYYHGPADWVVLPDLGEQPTLQRYDLLMRKMMTPDAAAPLLARIGRTLQSGHCVWFVGGWPLVPPGQSPPPQPNPERDGWHDEPYLTAWSVQVGCFVTAHAQSVRECRVDHNALPFEQLPLVMATGWKPSP